MPLLFNGVGQAMGHAAQPVPSPEPISGVGIWARDLDRYCTRLPEVAGQTLETR